MQKVPANQESFGGDIMLTMMRNVYLKQGHVGAIVAVALVVVCVVDKGTVFLWDAITWGDRVNIVARLSWIVLKVLRGERIAKFDSLTLTFTENIHCAQAGCFGVHSVLTITAQ